MKGDTEEERLRVLELYEVMDSAEEDVFDNLTRLAATICEAPISLISLVDDRRQWFKSRVGLDATETPRDQAFCAHAIEDNGLMVVEDATLDQRFVDNPLVTDDPSIRFYAGMPLAVTEHVRLGTLCVIDRKPRQLSAMQEEALAVLRDAVVAQLELRRVQRELRALESLVSICAWCRNIRVEKQDGGASWVTASDYLNQTKPVTHGICPTCAEELETQDH